MTPQQKTKISIKQGVFFKMSVALEDLKFRDKLVQSSGAKTANAFAFKPSPRGTLRGFRVFYMYNIYVVCVLSVTILTHNSVFCACLLAPLYVQLLLLSCRVRVCEPEVIHLGRWVLPVHINRDFCLAKNSDIIYS